MNRFFNLPNDIISEIYKFDPTYRDIYKKVMRQIMLYPRQCLRFKKKYQTFFGSELYGIHKDSLCGNFVYLSTLKNSGSFKHRSIILETYKVVLWTTVHEDEDFYWYGFEHRQNIIDEVHDNFEEEETDEDEEEEETDEDEE
jgi:hypothetical protein